MFKANVVCQPFRFTYYARGGGKGSQCLIWAESPAAARMQMDVVAQAKNLIPGPCLGLVSATDLAPDQHRKLSKKGVLFL